MIVATPRDTAMSQLADQTAKWAAAMSDALAPAIAGINRQGFADLGRQVAEQQQAMAKNLSEIAASEAMAGLVRLSRSAAEASTMARLSRQARETRRRELMLARLWCLRRAWLAFQEHLDRAAHPADLAHRLVSQVLAALSLLVEAVRQLVTELGERPLRAPPPPQLLALTTSTLTAAPPWAPAPTSFLAGARL